MSKRGHALDCRSGGHRPKWNRFRVQLKSVILVGIQRWQVWRNHGETLGVGFFILKHGPERLQIRKASKINFLYKTEFFNCFASVKIILIFGLDRKCTTALQTNTMNYLNQLKTVLTEKEKIQSSLFLHKTTCINNKLFTKSREPLII